MHCVHDVYHARWHGHLKSKDRREFPPVFPILSLIAPEGHARHAVNNISPFAAVAISPDASGRAVVRYPAEDTPPGRRAARAIHPIGAHQQRPTHRAPPPAGYTAGTAAGRIPAGSAAAAAGSCAGHRPDTPTPYSCLARSPPPLLTIAYIPPAGG